MTRFTPRIILPILVLLGTGLTSVRAVDMEALDRILSRRILPEDTLTTPTRELIRSGIKPPVVMNKASDWTRYAEYLREKLLEENILRGEAQAWAAAETRVEWLDEIDTGAGYRIRKLRYEALPGLWIPALLYQPDRIEGKIPVVMNVNGHDADGKAAPYKQIRCINQAKRGMAALNVEWFGMGQLRTPGFDHYRMNQLDLTGTSGIAPFYLSLKRGIDLLLSLEYADPERVAVAGLSGGGWQTIFIAALDPRVKLANPVAGYSSFHTRLDHLSDLGDSEQTPSGFAALADYTHLTGLVAPRPLLLTYNDKDACCFDSDHALAPLLEYATPVYRLYDKEDRLRHHINSDPGTHNFDRDNREALYRMLGDFLLTGDEDYSAEEIPCEAELLTAADLTVPMPDANRDFHTIALDLAAALPSSPLPPTDLREVQAWHNRMQSALGRSAPGTKSVITDLRILDKVRDGGLHAAILEVRASDSPPVSIIEIWQAAYPLNKKKVVFVCEGARTGSREEIARRLDAGQRLLVIEPPFTGETALTGRPHLTALALASVGGSMLGTQARGVASLSEWQKNRFIREVTLAADGPLSSLIVLIARALNPGCADRVEIRNSLGSLAEVIERDLTVDKEPAFFSFGLLSGCDIPSMVALSAPAEITVIEPSERVTRELSPLVDWYASRGGRLHLGAPDVPPPDPLPPGSKVTGFEEYEPRNRSAVISRQQPAPPDLPGPPAPPPAPAP